MSSVLVLPLLAIAAEDPAKTPPQEPPTPAAQLLNAIWDGNLAQARELLASGIDPNGDQKNRPLLLAVHLLNPDMVKLLLEYKADCNSKNKDGRGVQEVCMLKAWLKLVLGGEATQMEKDRDLIQATVLYHGGRMLREKSRIPHWGTGLIGHNIGQAFFWNGMGRRYNGSQMERSGAAAMAFLRKHGAGADPRSPVWTPTSNRRRERFQLDVFEGDAFAKGGMVWESAKGKRLVCGDGTYAPLWRFQYYFFDETLQLAGIGEGPRMPTGVAIVNQGTGSLIPYAFVEYRSRDERLPAAMRGTWMPALAYVKSEEKMSFETPIGFCTYYEPGYFAELPRGRAVILPIDLYGAPADVRAVEYGLWELKDVEVRFAEAGNAFPKEPIKLQEPPRPAPPQEKEADPEPMFGSSRRRERAPLPDPAKAKAYEQIFERVERMRSSKQMHLFCSADPGGVHCLCAYSTPVGWDGLFFAGTEWAPQKPVIDWRFRKGVVWKREGGDRIVIADARRSFALGTAGVFAFDKDLNMVAVGEYQTNDDNPESFALVEFRSPDPRLPAPTRGTWNLALAHNELYKQKIDATKPVSFGVWPIAAPGESSDPADQTNGNRLRIHPVDWYGDEVDHRSIEVPLCELKDLEIRVAEPDPPFRLQ